MNMLPIYSLLIAFCLAVVWAVDMPIYITTPSQVTAGTPFQATLNVEVHNGGTSYVKFFRIYLGASYQEKAHYFYHSDCYLIYEQSLCDSSIEVGGDYVLFNDTPFNVTIPPTVGPSGAHYVLIAQVHQTDGSWYGASLESEVFDLIDANGTWSSFQESGIGRTLWGDDGIPCGSYACVKNCADSSLGETNRTLYNNCANECPSVSIDFANSTVGGQPTASRTEPPDCGARASSTAVDPETTDVNHGASATQMRSATAQGTSSATSVQTPQVSLLDCLVIFAALFLSGW